MGQGTETVRGEPLYAVDNDDVHAFWHANLRSHIHRYGFRHSPEHADAHTITDAERDDLLDRIFHTNAHAHPSTDSDFIPEFLYRC